MAIYSIKDLEKLSGIKAHTIRIWEQRYDLLSPKRTPTNIRYYEDEDLKFLLNVALLNKNGIKISKIAKLTSEEINKKVAAISEVNYEFDTQLDALTISMIEMDEFKFDRILSVNIEQLGFEQTMLEVVQPFLEKLSVLWLTGSIYPVQENFISYLIRQKVIVAINNLPVKSGADVPKYLLYLPEGERQELSLLLLHYLLKKRGKHVIYIGQDMSLFDLKDVNYIHSPDVICTMITEAFAKEPVQQYVDTLCETFPETKFLLSGYQVIAQEVPETKQVTIVGSLQDTIAFLDRRETEKQREKQSGNQTSSN